VAYFSEKDFYFVDLYLADGNTGKVIRRLLKSSFSSNYETYRYINSSAAWSADGKYLVFAAKRGSRDDLVIVDPKRNKEVRRIRVKDTDGITNPSWSPDGTRIVFSGLVGGLSDLFTVGVDGKDLKRITSDKFADLQPVWSPDGRTIAFVTDRGPATDFTRMIWGTFRIALLDVETGRIDLPEAMGVGKNVSPQWSPDGQSLAFVSDRNAVNNLYLFETGDRQAYQLTDFYTGIQGITPLSPTLSWSKGSDRIAFVYFEQGKYDVYTLSSPRLLKKDPWRPSAGGPVVALRPGEIPTAPGAAAAPGGRPGAAAMQGPRPPFVLSGVSLYRSPAGFRRADSLAGPVDSAAMGPEPVNIARILDSTSYDLPDTAEFLHRSYRVKFNPEYVSQPTIGYARDNFGRGLYGQATIILGDMLGDQRMAFSKGRPSTSSSTGGISTGRSSAASTIPPAASPGGNWGSRAPSWTRTSSSTTSPTRSRPASRPTSCGAEPRTSPRISMRCPPWRTCSTTPCTAMSAPSWGDGPGWRSPSPSAPGSSSRARWTCDGTIRCRDR
jgi:Tol biopolymer transport system component